MSNKVETLTEGARSLIQRAFKIHHPVYGFSTTSTQIYDTAWVAMISKAVDGEKQWLFPESFQYLLKWQADDGSWGRHPKTKTVGILDTAAALLALFRHLKEPLQLHDESPEDIRLRIARAVQSLRIQLAAWDDILTTNHIGVEIIAPALLIYLESEDSNLVFEFQGKQMLMDMNKAKLARFDPESLYRTRPSSTVHSLEAFISKVDFDKIGHHLFRGSMLASPSSTAAYLMHASVWDDEAEAYLDHVVNLGSGNGHGGIPGTHSTAYFEFNWIIATLLRGAFRRADIECSELFGIGKIILEGFEADQGVIGFAPRAVDVDDTAKGLLTLSLLDMDEGVSPAPMVAIFEAENHFRTFGAERDPSFTSNCHVLLALLQRADRDQFLPQIKKVVSFLCQSWWDCDGLIKDKWHLSHLYPTMLLVQGFIDLIWHTEHGAFSDVFHPELLSRVSICIFQACLRTILGQNLDGSWNGQPEETSYAILTLGEAARLLLFKDLQSVLTSAIRRGSTFLQSNHWTSPDQNWTSKTAYRATFVAEAYWLAAVKVGLDPIGETALSVGHSLESPQLSKRMNGYLNTVSQTKLFSSMPFWELRASFVESMLFAPLLRAERLKVYDRDHMGISRDSYLDIIPFTWIGCNNRSRTYVATSLLFDMMILSMLGYQTDEFIEAIAAPAFAHDTVQLHELIDDIIDRNVVTHIHFTHSPIRNDISKDRDIVKVSLQRFVNHVLEHKQIRKASPEDQATLRHELRAFLHAHTTQIESNAGIMRPGRSSDGLSWHDSGRPFFDWVRTTAADHVACAYSFAFNHCLLSALIGDGKNVFPTVKENYLVRAVARHMATMCRLCNDFGSVDRDLLEGNLNSVDFPEFVNVPSVLEKKRILAELAEYERRCLFHTLQELELAATQSAKQANSIGQFNKRKVKVVRYFADVTDFYDQLYLVRDLSSTVRQDQTPEGDME
ncbi:Ent-kaur-16-ene synthase [Dothidotthia symphoricarpi CBS 119687]|uniref:Ent-kaur-16-ene synthase n=1 Tax=Dothidotthia symphoricarpi CBS 119687 TaxID=1392245 RepID=A0A6A6AE16_9PLEO|nr:Ent-kaur-16-ene synthase [Dothidotthia symphoricarpi CBS 119687]KAF2129174.1 Ent-kaur-16-ene synthase [Dothidotthia symphoricarpi CBS 119687]